MQSQQMNLKKKIISKEIERRQALREAIRFGISKQFLLSQNKYTRRGLVQKYVSKFLKVRQNNTLAREVIAFLESEGCESVCIHGKYYFKNICSLDFVLTNDDIDERL